mgnify:CR=1 FL=1
MQHVVSSRSRGAYFRVPFKEGCDIVDREYFAGARINDVPSDSGGIASENCDAAMEGLFADRVPPWTRVHPIIRRRGPSGLLGKNG